MSHEKENLGPAKASSAEHIHAMFGLSYANYLVLHRSMLQSMPETWQKRFVQCMQELNEAFDGIERPDAYQVTTGEEVEYAELSDAQLLKLGITRDEVDEEDENAPEPYYYDAQGVQHEGWERTLLPTRDPVPHYNKGRTQLQVVSTEPITEEFLLELGFERQQDGRRGEKRFTHPQLDDSISFEFTLNRELGVFFEWGAVDGILIPVADGRGRLHDFMRAALG
jgi:hypothetical protein